MESNGPRRPLPPSSRPEGVMPSPAPTPDPCYWLLVEGIPVGPFDANQVRAKLAAGGVVGCTKSKPTRVCSFCHGSGQGRDGGCRLCHVFPLSLTPPASLRYSVAACPRLSSLWRAP